MKHKDSIILASIFISMIVLSFFVRLNHPIDNGEIMVFRHLIISFTEKKNFTVTLYGQNGLKLEEIQVNDGIGSSHFEYPILRMVRHPLGFYEEQRLTYYLKIDEGFLSLTFDPLNRTHAFTPIIQLKGEYGKDEF